MSASENTKSTTDEGKKRAHRRYADAVLALTRVIGPTLKHSAMRCSVNVGEWMEWTVYNDVLRGRESRLYVDYMGGTATTGGPNLLRSRLLYSFRPQSHRR